MSGEQAQGNPYVGPRTFTEKDSGLFFGRDQEARDLLGRVISERLLLFYAQSGAGKSSLINARLVPELRDEGFAVLPVSRVSGSVPPGVDTVDNIYLFNLMLSIDQGENPPASFAALALPDFLARLTTENGIEWCYEAGAAPAAASTGSQPYVLIIDQFEEIVTAHAGRWQEREPFFAQLDAAMRTDPNLWVVLTLREDYVAALDPFAALMSDRLRARFYMERMGVTAALEAVREPAVLAGRPFAPGVAEKLVDDLRQVRVAGQEGTSAGKYVEPVQLQVVCHQLWERLTGVGAESPGAISEKDLTEAGDVNQALTRFYDDTLAAVLAEPAAAAGVTERSLRQWFDRELITETGIRSTVFRNEVVGRTGSLPNASVDALARRFLVRTELRGGGAWVELVHDRFVEPVRASNAAWWTEHLSAWQQQAALWDVHGRPDGLLLRGSALIEAEALAEGHPGDLQPQEVAFLQECRAARTVAKREARQNRLIRLLAWVAGAVAVVAVVAALLAARSQRAATDQAAIAEAQTNVAHAAATVASDAEHRALAEAQRASSLARRNRAAALTAYAENALAAPRDDPDGSLALILARQAVTATWDEDHYVTPNADAVLRRAINAAPPWVRTFRHGGTINSVAFSQDGRAIVTAGNDGNARIWGSATGELLHLLPVDAAGVNAVAFSPDPSGTLVVTAGEGGTIRLWDSRSGSLVRALDPLTASVQSAVFSPDGKTILVASRDGTARQWDTENGRPLLTLDHRNGVFSAVFSPDGKTILTADVSPSAWLWDATNGKPLGPVAATEDSVADGVIFAAFTAGGKSIIVNRQSGDTELWDVSTHLRVRVWPRLLHQMYSHSPGHPLYSSPLSLDGQIIVHDPGSRSIGLGAADTLPEKPPLSELAIDGSLTALAFSPDGKRVLTAGDAGTADLWNLPSAADTLMSASISVDKSAFSPDGQTILAVYGNQGVTWDASTGTRLGATRGDQFAMTFAAYSADGKRIVTTSLNYTSTAQLWDAATLKPLQTLSTKRPDGAPSPAHFAVFSPDSRYILTLGIQRDARLWDVTSGTSPCAFEGADFSVTPSAFGGDGKTIVVPVENAARLLDFADCQQANPLFVGHIATVNSAVFSPNGETVLTASSDGTARVWNAKSGQEIGTLDARAGPLNSAAFSPDGQSILTAGKDGVARIWSAATFTETSRLVGHAGSVDSATFSRDGGMIMTVDADRVTRLWVAPDGEVSWRLVAVISQADSGPISPDGRTVLANDGERSTLLPARDDDLLALAARLIRRNPPELTAEERVRFHLDQ